MKKNHCDFPTYMASLARSLRRQGRFGTAHVYEAALRRVLHFSRGRPLPFSRVDREWLLAFQNYLLERQLRWNQQPALPQVCRDYEPAVPDERRNHQMG